MLAEIYLKINLVSSIIEVFDHLSSMASNFNLGYIAEFDLRTATASLTGC